MRTDQSDVLATAYCKENKVLVALASWAREPVRCPLQIDWEAVGLDARKTTLHAPAIPEFQEVMLPVMSTLVIVTFLRRRGSGRRERD